MQEIMIIFLIYNQLTEYNMLILIKTLHLECKFSFVLYVKIIIIIEQDIFFDISTTFGKCVGIAYILEN